MIRDDGGCAFAGATGSDGMSLRDWFAGQALTAKMPGGLIGYEDHAPDHRAKLIQRLVRDAYEVADAMLAERRKP